MFYYKNMKMKLILVKYACKILNVCSATKFPFLFTGVLNRVTAIETMPGDKNCMHPTD
jgi:hypothetical protein